MHIDKYVPISGAIIGHKYQLQYNETWHGIHVFLLKVNVKACERKTLSAAPLKLNKTIKLN
jgi:hypothetical protein